MLFSLSIFVFSVCALIISSCVYFQGFNYACYETPMKPQTLFAAQEKYVQYNI